MIFFFARANQTLETCVKTYINHFHGNHFWTPSKSFSCAVNHFQTSRKWFLTHVNDFFQQKTARNVFFLAVNHLLKIISKWKSFFWQRKSSFPKRRKSFLWESLPTISRHWYFRCKCFFPQEQIKCSKVAGKMKKIISTEIIFGFLLNHFLV